MYLEKAARTDSFPETFYKVVSNLVDLMKKHWPVVFFAALIAAMTYPLIFKINSYIPGFFSSDESFAPIWSAWWMKICVLNKLPLDQITYISYPFKVDYYVFGYLSFLTHFLFSILTNPVLTYNLQILLNIFLSCIFTYLLSFHLTKSKVSGFFSGVIFGLSPYIFVRSWQHIGETYLWMMPLMLWSLFRLKDSSKNIYKIIFVLSFSIATISFDTVYYMGVIASVFFLYDGFDFLRKKRNRSNKINVAERKFILNIFLLSIISIFCVLILVFPFLKKVIISPQATPSAHNPYHRPFDDLFAQSARPLSYILPATVHPVFGQFTEQFIGTSLYGESFTEHTLYLGWTPLILAFFALRTWRKNRKTLPGNSTAAECDKEAFNLGFFITLAIAAWFFSQPPWWKVGPIKIYMPSFFMYRVLPMFRAYCRFGIVLMLAVSVLAGFGLKFYSERFKVSKLRIIAAMLLVSVVLFEFWNYPPFKVIDVSKVPAVYNWLKEQPGDLIIAEYPLDSDSPNELYKLFQTIHEKKIINGTVPGTYANKVARTITKLSEPKTASILKWMGVKYVLVHTDSYLQTELIEDKNELDRISRNTKFKFLKEFPPQDCPNKDIMCVQKTGSINIYEVIASPIKPESEK